MRTHRSLVTLVLVLAILASLPSAWALPPTGPGTPTWAPDWMKNGSGHSAYDPGRTIALRQARKFDVVIAHWATYDDYTTAMRNVNPNLRLLVYTQGAFSVDPGLPSGWYARSRSGAKIKSRQFGTYLMNPKSPGWRKAVLRMCRQRRVASSYDGCFLDSLGPSGVNLASVTALPVNPSTGNVYTRRQWLSATEVVAAKVKHALAPRPVVLNGLVDGSGYVNPAGPTERLLNGATGGMSEAFIRSAKTGATSYKSEKAWRRDVDMLRDAGARASGGIVFAVTKVWASASASQIGSWHRYALSSFLLGYRPRHGYFSFRSDHDLTKPYAMEDVRLGSPKHGYFRASGMYVRNFRFGKVVVNPTTSSHSLSLGRRYVDLAGVIRTSSISLPAHSGTILELA